MEAGACMAPGRDRPGPVLTSEFYRRINELADAALELPAARRASFIAESCPDEPELLAKVTAVVSAHESGEEFLAEPVLETLARQVASEWEQQAAKPGTIIGRYELIRRLGGGGHGEVWLAHDPQLGREVALKLLNPTFGDRTGQVTRLYQEARAASRLNHPNIVTIHEIGEAGGTHFIAQEFVGGETLRSAIAAKRIRPVEALRIASQVASALEAASAAGIAHRDVKPENVMIRPDGLVKLLDFGLASHGDGESRPPGLMGTAKYVSPEQVKGGTADARSDLFSLGVMLHEMLSGKAPFAGNTIPETLSAIAESDAPPLPESLSERVELEKLVRRCLEKDPESRYGSAAGLRADLARAIGRMENRPQRQKIWFASAALGTIAVAALLMLYRIAESRGAATFTSMTIARLVTRGVVSDAAISPDGASIAYTLDEGDRQGVWVRRSNQDIQLVPPEASEHSGLIFSPAEDSIYFIRREAGGLGGLFKIGARGGMPERILNDLSGPIAFSPDAKQFAFVRLDRADTSLMIANADGSGVRTVALRRAPRYFSRNGLAWSADGRTIFCPGGQEAFYTPSAFHLIAVRVADGAESEIGNRAWPWVDSLLRTQNVLLLAASDVAEDSRQIWQVSLPRGEVRRVTNDLTDYSTLSVSKDGASMTAIQRETPAALWLATLGEPNGTARVSHGELRGFNSVAWAPGGHIVYSARAGEYRNIWITDVSGENPRQIGDAGADRDEVAVTPDGRYILYQSKGKIWRMNADGGGATQLTHGALDVHPWPSADGREVFYSSFDPWSPVIGGTPALWRVPIDGGAASPIRPEPLSMAHVAPDGQRLAAIYFAGRDSRFVPRRLAVFPVTGQPPMLLIGLLPGAYGHSEWTGDGKALLSSATTASIGNLWRQPLDGSRASRLTDFRSDLILDFASSSDAKKIVVARGNPSSDVVLLRNFH